MPAHLEWKDVDFSGGLWDRDTDFDVPDNGLIDLVDAYPLLTGSLRAGMKWTTESVTNLPTSKQVTGFFTYRQGEGANQYGLIALAPTAFPGTVELYRSGLADGFSWNAAPVGSFTGVTAPAPVHFAHWSPGSQTLFFVVVPNADAATRGVWEVQTSPFLIVRRLDTDGYFVTTHQDALITIEVNRQFRQQLRFSEAGNQSSWPAANILIPDASSASPVFDLVPSFPNELIAVKQLHGVYSIQGNLSAPTVRRVSLDHPPQQYSWGAFVKGAYTYLTEDEGIWAISGGGEPVHMSPQIVGSKMTTPGIGNADQDPKFLGQVLYAGNFLFTPEGYVYDFRTQAWHKSSTPNSDNPYLFWQYEPFTGRVYAAGHSSSNVARIISASINEDTMSRATTYNFTLPLLRDEDRMVSLREIQAEFQTFALPSTVKFDVTVDGSAQTQQTFTLAAGTQTRRFVFNYTGRIIKVKVTVSGTAGEAPTIRNFRHATLKRGRFTQTSS